VFVFLEDTCAGIEIPANPGRESCLPDRGLCSWIFLLSGASTGFSGFQLELVSSEKRSPMHAQVSVGEIFSPFLPIAGI